MRSPAIGIDLGTSFSSVAVWKDGRVELVPLDHGDTMRSCVAFTAMGSYVGDAAFNQAEANPENTAYNTKRLVGRRLSDLEVQNDLTLWTTKIASGEGDRPLVVVRYNGKTRTFAAEEISAMILMKLKKSAETYLGCAVQDVVITVPCKFGVAQRLATKNACVIAGLNVLQVLNESTATAITYTHSLKTSKSANADDTTNNASSLPPWMLWKSTPKNSEITEKNVVIFDLGGTWLNVSLVSLIEGTWQVRSVCGESHLGGEDFDNRMVNYYISEYYKKHGKDISKDGRSLRRLRGACERAKCVVSSTEETTSLCLESFFEKTCFQSVFAYNNFELLNRDLFKKCKSTVMTCMKDGKKQCQSVTSVVLVGGSSGIPKIRRMLKNIFRSAQVLDNISPQPVSYGAALHAASLNGDSPELSVLDVTTNSISIGVSDHSGTYKVDIPKFSAIPAQGTRTMISTLNDNQSSIDFTILEGDNLRESSIVGQYRLSGIPQAPKGLPQIQVHLNVDSSGLLNLVGEIDVTGVTRTVPITCVTGNKEEIEKMVAEAQLFLAEDEEFRKRGTARDALERYAESILAEHANSNNKEAISTAVGLVLGWVKQSELLDLSQYDEKKRWLLEYNRLVSQSKTINGLETESNQFDLESKNFSDLELETVRDFRIGSSTRSLMIWLALLLVGIGLAYVGAIMFPSSI